MITNEFGFQNHHSSKVTTNFDANKVDDFLKCNEMYDNRNYLDSSLDNISKWEDFNESLNYYLALFSFNDATCLIREFIKLEEYLNCEYNVNEREKNMYFASQEKLREYLNQNLNVSFFFLYFL
jgi:hypothetical protein